MTVFNVRYFYVLNVHLDGLLFMKFHVTEKIKYCLSHFICSFISIYTYSSVLKLFMMLKQTKKVKKLINWVILVADVYVCYTLMLRVNFTQIFRKKYIDMLSESAVSLLFISSELQVKFNWNFDSKMRHKMAGWHFWIHETKSIWYLKSKKHENIWFWSKVQISFHCI